VTVIAVYRYLIVVHPRQLGVVLLRRRSVVLILAAMYVVPLVLVLVKYWTRLIPSGTGCATVFNRYTTFCSFVRHSEFQHFGVVKKFGVVSLCAAIVGFSYVRIYCLVRCQGRRLNVIVTSGVLGNAVSVATLTVFDNVLDEVVY